MKRKRHAFFTAFFVTCVVIGGFCSLLWVDESNRAIRLGDTPSILYMEALSSTSVRVGVMGNELSLPMEQLNTAIGFLGQYPALIPRSLRLMGQWSTVAAQQLQALEDAYWEEQFQQSLR